MTRASTPADPRPRNGVLFVLMSVLLAAAIATQVVRDRGWAPYEPANPLLWVRSAPLMQRLALSFDSLAADVYWMRAVVYYGGKRMAPEATRNYDLLHPLLELVTTLDPHFRVAYRFGAIFLTEAFPAGPGRPDLAVALLEKGIANDFGRWEYFQDIGFVHYWWRRDFQSAAVWFEKAGRQPGAPAWLAPLAAVTLVHGGDRQSARFLWRQLAETSEAEWIRRNAAIRLQQLDALDVIDELNRISARFTARVGRPPADWRELVAAERLRGIPVDPSGTPYVLDSRTGSVTVDTTSRLFPLPTAMNPQATPVP